MAVKLRFIILVMLLVLLLISCQKYGTVNIVSDIDESVDILSAKELMQLITPHVDEYFKGKENHLGQIYYLFGEDNLERLYFMFADKSKRARVVDVRVNVNEREITRRYVGRESKADPGMINFSEWEIDSHTAMEFAMNRLEEKYGKRKYSQIILKSNNNNTDNPEQWRIYANHEDLQYSVHINPYTGEISDGFSRLPNR